MGLAPLRSQPQVPARLPSEQLRETVCVTPPAERMAWTKADSRVLRGRRRFWNSVVGQFHGSVENWAAHSAMASSAPAVTLRLSDSVE